MAARYGEAKRWLADYMANLPDTDECVEWPFSILNGGNASVGNTTVGRVLLGLRKGDPLVVRHQCHNGSCVNPRHMITGTPAENSADMVRAGRSLKGDRNPARVKKLARGYL